MNSYYFVHFMVNIFALICIMLSTSALRILTRRLHHSLIIGHRASVLSSSFGNRSHNAYSKFSGDFPGNSKPEASSISFDESLASALAAYSFEVYNEPFVGKPAIGLDNTKVYFSSLQHIRNSFSGVAIVTFKKVKLIKAEETQLAERLVSGSKPDPYIIGAAYERYSEDPLENRVLDSVRSTTKHNTDEATWSGQGQLQGRIGESYALYIRDTNTTAIEFSVFDQEIFSVDEFLGNSILSFQELKQIMQQREDSSGLPESKWAEDYDLMLPIYADEMPSKDKVSLMQSMKDFLLQKSKKQRIRVGTLGVAVKYLPWTLLTDEQMSNLVVLGQTNILDLENTPTNQNRGDIISSKTIGDSLGETKDSSAAVSFSQQSKNNTSSNERGSVSSSIDWATFLSQQAQQLPSIPSTATNLIQSVEKDLRNRTTFMFQSLQEKLSTMTPLQLMNTTINNMSTTATESRSDDNDARSLKTTMFTKSFLPRGAMPGVADWPTLLRRVLSSTTTSSTSSFPGKNRSGMPLMNQLINENMHQICLIDSPETDTQVALWADTHARSLIVSFRGTELVRIKDILTDINLFQAPFRPDHKELAQTRIHQGFLRAYDSVQLALLQQLHDIFSLPDQHNDAITRSAAFSRPWTIYITGHSLGGALGTLFAFDLARIRAGMYNMSAATSTTTSNASAIDSWTNLFSSEKNESTNATIAIPLQSHKKSDEFRIPRHVHFANSLVRPEADAALIFLTPDPRQATEHASSAPIPAPSRSVFADELHNAELVVYTYGAPRVGDPVFKRLFDDLVPHCFRVVNRQDIVARMPRNVTLPIALAPSATTPSANERKSAKSKSASLSKLKKQRDVSSTDKLENLREKGSLKGTSTSLYTMYFAHVGRTVLVDDQYAPPPSATISPSSTTTTQRRRRKGVWIEHETLRECPLSQDGSLFLSATATAAGSSGAETSLSAAVTAKTSEVSTVAQAMLQDWQAKLRPAMAQAVDSASRNVNDMVEQHWKAMTAESTTATSGDNKAEKWSNVTADLVQRLRNSANTASAIRNISVSETATAMKSSVEEKVADQWRVLESSLSAWKSSATASDDRTAQEKQQQQWKQIMEVASALGVDTLFLERELALLTSLWDRTAIDHHLEDSYYAAMCRVTGCDDLIPVSTASATAASNTTTRTAEVR